MKTVKWLVCRLYAAAGCFFPTSPCRSSHDAVPYLIACPAQVVSIEIHQIKRTPKLVTRREHNRLEIEMYSRWNGPGQVSPIIIFSWTTLLLSAPYAGAGLRVGPLVVRPQDIVLGIGIILSLSLIQQIASNLKRAPGCRWYLVALLLPVATVMFWKGAPIDEIANLRRISLPAVSALVVFSAFVHDRKSFLSIAWGVITASVICSARLFWIFGNSAFGIRPIPSVPFVKASQYSYITLGLLGGSAIIMSLYLISLTGVFSGHSKIIQFGPILGMISGAYLCLFSGTRAVLMVVFCVIVYVILGKRILAPVSKGVKLVYVSIVCLAFVVSNCPSVAWYFIPRPAFTKIAGERQGTDRLLDEEGYATSLSDRIVWWDLMMQHQTVSEILLGSDYAARVGRAVVVAHPHNILVWLQLMGGLPASLLFAIGLGRLGSWSLEALRADWVAGDHQLLALGMVLLVFPVILTNSMVSGIGFFVSLAFAIAGAPMIAETGKPRRG